MKEIDWRRIAMDAMMSIAVITLVRVPMIWISWNFIAMALDLPKISYIVAFFARIAMRNLIAKN